MNPKINTHSLANHLQLVERYIQALSHAMATGILRPDQITRVQARLDHIERDIKLRTGTVADSIYGPMLELQSLIYIASNRHHLVPAVVEELENLPKEYTVRSQVFGEYVQSNMGGTATQSHASGQPHAHHKKPKSKRRSRLFAGVAVLLLVGMASFITVTGKMNPVTMAKQYSLSKSLSTQYKACTESLAAKKAATDTSDPLAISKYNAAYNECERIRAYQNTVAEDFKSQLSFGGSNTASTTQ